MQLSCKFPPCPDHDPDATVWFGVEIARPMKLNVVKRSICTVLLQFVAAFGRGMHVAFGDTLDGQRPHIVFPLMGLIDRMVVTPPGGTPPVLGETPLPETPELAQLKKTQSELSLFQTDSTYTMSFYSAYIDFENWTTVGLPGVGKLDLHRFWEDQSMFLVMYTLPVGEKVHDVATRRELMRVEILHQSLPRAAEFKIIE
eukprot:NODE_4290_length_833_cov_24.320153_g3963_i0.p1 GENE.NODE_4290_length_833_cov_24.320153_g3963_i0~~NODE_4290_length_833_cov_24.320153_g3963_i0.p1  ORF type:complete len:222 (+),score=40.69 NODE_4290_length_833_cov_24.320153_g3963_i0:67-666(+)